MTLPDEAARQRIETDLDATLFVEAAAGTGKTTALVKRIVRLVATGTVAMPHIAAITFTEKAAAELRDRVRQALTEAASGDQPDPEEARRCGEALGQIEDAAICTLHAFAQRILLEHPLEAGLPPRLEVMDDLEATADFDTSWEQFLASWLDEDDRALRVAFVMGARPQHLRDLALAFRAHWDRLGEGWSDPPSLPDLEVTEIVTALERAFAGAKHCRDASDPLAVHLDSLVGYLDRLRSIGTNGDPLDVLAAFVDAPKIAAGRTGRQGNWGSKAHIGAVRDALADADTARTHALGAIGHAVAVHIAHRVRDFTIEGAESRRRSGRLEFQDLLALARNLLRDHPDARQALRQRWRRLLIDEFQDTDPLQTEIAVLLTSDGTASTHWSELDVRAGHLFMVGDPKQSIYRFRRADVALYQRVGAKFRDGVLGLEANFRCAPPIVDWVNQVFETFMATGTLDLQPPYTALRAVRTARAPGVHVLGGASDARMSEIRRREAHDLARTAAAVRDDGWIVHEDGPDGDPGRSASFRDVAILMPTRRLLPDLEAALQAQGVPYRIESRSLLWSTQEVRDLLAVLAAADDPSDEVAVIAALRSPGFAVDDPCLLEWRQGGGRWNPRAERPSGLADHPVAFALDRLAVLHEARHWVPLHEFVERVIREQRLLELQAAHRRPRDHRRRLRFVADQARAFVESGGATLRGFVEWAHRQADEQVAVNEAIVAEPDDDAVRIMTVHAAKGLEFPVVLLAGINSRRPHRPAPALFHDDGRVEVHLGRTDSYVRTSGHADRHTREQQADDEEAIRVLYVAATRARDHLVVSLHHSGRGGPTHARRLAEECSLDEFWHEPDGYLPPADTKPPARVVDEGFEAWADAHRALSSAAVAPAVSATALGADHDTEPEAGPSPPWKRGRAGTSVGRAVHAVLQTIDLGTGEGLGDAARAQAEAEGVADRTADVERLARAALASGAVRSAVASGRVWREVSVGVPIEGTLVEGFIDLLYEAPEGLVVVDYKTDRLDPDDPELQDRYHLQGAAYALALSEVLRRPVARCVFVFVGDGHPREVEIDDLPTAVRDVRQAIAAR